MNRRQHPTSRWANIVVGLVAVAAIAATCWNIHRQLSSWKPSSHGAGAPPGYSAFDLSAATIPAEHIRSGGPAKDGIPALTAPKFVAASAATFLEPTDSVIGVTLNGDSRAYPLAILDLHEVVNDTVGDTPIAVTYCPLCDSSAVFDRRIAGQQRELGVSGRLYNSNVLMYDRQESDTESLVSQMMARGVSGPLANVSLARLPLEVTTWQSWLERHPSSKVLSPDTGFGRNYDRSVYAHYFESPRLMFAIEPTDQRLAPKTRVLGVAADGLHRAYPVERLLANAEGPVPQTLGESRFVVVPDPQARSLRVEEAPDSVEFVYSFWFAWFATNPETELWRAE